VYTHPIFTMKLIDTIDLVLCLYWTLSCLGNLIYSASLFSWALRNLVYEYRLVLKSKHF
jgi:hypothetical protein